MTTVEKRSGLRQRIAAALAFMRWIYQEAQRFDESKLKAEQEWHAAIDDVKALEKARMLGLDRPKNIPCLHCHRLIPEYDARCSGCGHLQNENGEGDTQPLYWIRLNNTLHYFENIGSGKALIDGKRPFEAYIGHELPDVDTPPKNDEWWLL